MSKINLNHVYVAESKIHGKGLFAKRQIKEGEVIGMVTGEWTKTDGPHVLWVNNKKGFQVSCDLRYINHSKKPNACYYDSLEVIAIKDIQANEEITHNYQW